MLPGRTGSVRILGCIEPCSQTCRPVILAANPVPLFVVVAAVTAGNGIVSGPKVNPPSVERRIRISPLVATVALVLVCQATKTSPLGATSTSLGQTKPSPAPDKFPGRVVHVTPWSVERAKRTGGFVWPKSFHTT